MDTSVKKRGGYRPNSGRKKGGISWNTGLKLDKQIYPNMGFRKGYYNSVKGEDHHLWIKDRSLIKRQIERNNPEYKHWRQQVWLRDNWKCKIANPECCGKIEAHHILGWATFPELRYEVNNGITLCHFHHPRKKSEERRLSPYFQEIINNLKH